MADSCAQYVSTDDLKAAKESILHIEHVATSKDANGNPARVVTDPIRGVGYTNATLDGLFSDIGFKPVNGSFEDGGTLVNRWDVLLYETNGGFYQWMDALPHSVPAGSSPFNSSGQLINGWEDRSELVLRRDLAEKTGSSLIGYENKNSNNIESVERALDKLNETIIYAQDYGVVADNMTNNTTALSALSAAVTAMTDSVVKVVFPRGIILCGAQKQANASGLGYSFEPVYEATGLRGYFCVDGRQGITILEGYGTTIKLVSGLKTGSFDPVTGSPRPGPDTNSDYKAYAGHAISMLRCEDVYILGFKLDGNAAGATLGGKFGDDGWQCDSFGIWCAENVKAVIEDVKAYDWVLDSLYLAQSSTWSPSYNGVQRSVEVKRCEFRDSRRQGVSIAGGEHISIDQSIIRNIGRYAEGAGSFYSAPEACIDIETETSTVRDVWITNSELLYGRYTLLAMSIDANAKRCYLKNTMIRSNSNYTSVLSKMPGLVFDNCVLEGAGCEFQDGIPSAELYPAIYHCTIKNHLDGNPVSSSRIIGKVAAINDSQFHYLLNANWLAPLVITKPNGIGEFSFSGNGMSVFGSSVGVPVNGAGRVEIAALTGYQGIDLVVSDGSSGSANLQITTSSVSVNAKGITADTAKVKDVNGNSLTLIDGRYALPLSVNLNVQRVIPQYAGQSLGDDTHRFGDIYSVGTILLKSPDGTKYRLSINNGGTLDISPQ